MGIGEFVGWVEGGPEGSAISGRPLQPNNSKLNLITRIKFSKDKKCSKGGISGLFSWS